jgi:hypothetical protein
MSGDTYGMKANVGISFQNSYGTALASSIYWIPYLSEGFAVSKEPVISENMSGVFDEGVHYEGLNANDGTIEAEANPIALGAMFKAMFGAPSTVTSGAYYTHTFKPRTGDFDDFSAQIPVTVTKALGDTGSAHQFYDMNASKLSLSVANGELLKASIEFMGGKYSQVTAPAASYPTGKGWMWDVASVSIAGAANADISELNLELDEALENKYTLNNTKTPSRTKRSGRRTLSVGGTLIFDNQTEYQQFLSQTERNLTVNMRGTVAVQSGYYDSLTLIVPLFRYVEFKPVAGGAEKIEVGFSGKGVYSTTSATALHVTLSNTQAAY